MKNGQPPLIAITCGSNADIPRNRQSYITAVKKAGGEAVFAPPQSDVYDLATRYDGFIIPGGGDLHASLYGEDQVCRIVPEERVRTDFEFSLLHEIMERKKPVFGICYGMQLINIFFQGNLYQDLPLQAPESLEHAVGEHGVIVRNNPFIEAMESIVTSSHHQAVKRVGKGLMPFAWAQDGVIEALYGEGLLFLVGVQWHPERMGSFLSERLFESFIVACRAQG